MYADFCGFLRISADFYGLLRSIADFYGYVVFLNLFLRSFFNFFANFAEPKRSRSGAEANRSGAEASRREANSEFWDRQVNFVTQR